MKKKKIILPLTYDSLIQTKVESSIKKKLRRFAKEDKTGVSTLIRKLAYNYIEEREKNESPNFKNR